MLKISTKISLLYFVATAVIIAVMAFSTYFIYHNQRLQAIDDELFNYSQFLTTDHEYQKKSLDAVFKLLTDRRDKSKGKLRFNYNFILVGKDSILYEADERLNLDLIIGQILEYDEGKDKKDHATITVNNLDYRIYEHKLRKEKEQAELDILMVASLDKFNESLSQITYILFIISPLLLIIAAIIGYFITRRALNPVRQITMTAESISGRNLDGRVPVSKADDELSLLARTFNDMIDRLQRIINSQKRFIADASHDFRTPLSIIRLELEMLEQKHDMSIESKESITKSIKQLKSLSSMAENLLLLARADARQLRLNRTPVRMDELIMDTVSDFNKKALEKDIKFNVDIPEPVELSADYDMMKRVLNNAIDNAVNYSNKSASVMINLKNEGERLSICISNQGPAITAEEIETMFDRFLRNDKARTTKGFGLGLPIIRTLVELHAGTVVFKSENQVNSLSITIKK